MPYVSIRTVPHFYVLTPPILGGSTLVFIHGWLLSHHYWAPVMDGLQAHCQCLAYDLRGFGASNQLATPSSEVGDYGLAAYGEDLGALLDHLGLEQVWLVGHSLGGSIALWGAHLWPDRVVGVVCVNAGGGIYLPQEFHKFRTAGAQIVRWRSPWLRHLPLMELGFTRMMVARPLGRQWGRQRLVDLLAAHPEAALGALLASTTEAAVHQLPQVVAGLRQPVYFVAGQEDQVMAERYVRHLASFHALFPTLGSNVRVLANCGHLAMVEQPQALGQHIRQWVGLPQGVAPKR